MGQSGTDRHQILFAIANPAMILAPRHFGGIRGEVRAADVVVNANLSAADAREEAFRAVGAGLAV